MGAIPISYTSSQFLSANCIVAPRSLIIAKPSTVETQTIYTKGKVRKIIIALVLLFEIMIGTGFEPARFMLPLLIG
jgi:hypothetical protein